MNRRMTAIVERDGDGYVAQSGVPRSEFEEDS